MTITRVRSFAHLADAIRAIASEQRPADSPPMTPREVRQAAESFTRARNLGLEAGRQVEPLVSNPAALARAVLEAHERATGKRTSPTPPPAGVAASILAADRKRRGEATE